MLERAYQAKVLVLLVSIGFACGCSGKRFVFEQAQFHQNFAVKQPSEKETPMIESWEGTIMLDRQTREAWLLMPKLVKPNDFTRPDWQKLERINLKNGVEAR
jgi:hypothetical protein